MTAPTDKRVTTQAEYGAWRRALHLSDLTPRTILLGLRLGEYVNPGKGWIAWPAQSTLARETLGSASPTAVRAVRRRVGELIGAGWVLIDKPATKRHSATYALPARGSIEPPQRGSIDPPHNGSKEPPQRGSSEPPKGSRHSVKEWSRNRKASGSADPAPADAGPVAVTGHEQDGDDLYGGPVPWQEA